MAGLESVGTVVRWSQEEGWGVLESPELAGGCWVHFSCVLAEGDRAGELKVGQVVPFGYEAAEQDGHPFLATWVGSLALDQARRPGPDAQTGLGKPSQTYASTLTITDDDDDDDDDDDGSDGTKGS